MESKFERVVLTVSPELADLRIDKVLATVPTIATRSQAVRLLQQGRVRIAGKVLKPSYLAQAGDVVDIDVPIEVKTELVPYDFPLVIPYEDEDLIVVDKPAGLVVHPAYGHAQDTLVNALLHYTKDLSLGFNEQRPGLVHRIDKDTSGLLVIAKNETAQRLLAMQFQKKTTHRLYRALVFGKLNEPNGIIRSNLKRHPDDRKRVASVPDGVEGGKPAVTHYSVKQYHQTGISLVELRLETGRTHQIRVHLSELGHPIIGDNTYGAGKRLKSLKSVHLRKMIEEMPRFALHAMELGFVHPRTQKKFIFKAPWPKDLMALVEHCEFPRYDANHVVIIDGQEDS
ncbi:MAG TPA: RluA family pseudouridine synthase [Bdellovibrionales bacterium]|nr:RluA family pseudouridine synthase [Bdellovibrionales bacterium]